MAEDMLSPRSDFGRTFISAMWILGAVAAFQVVAVGWAVLTQKPREVLVTAPPVTPDVPTPQAAAQNPPSIDPPDSNPATQEVNTVTPPPTAVIPPTTAGLPPVSPIPEPTFISPQKIQTPHTPTQKPLGSALADNALKSHPAHRINDPLLDKIVATGEELRGTGNMQGALKALRTAEDALPDHPRVLAELAGTFSQMGLEQKALDYWERVYELGEENAGGYYALADMALKGNLASAAGTTSAVLKIKNVSVEKIPTTEDEGEKVVLSVVVDGDNKVRPSGAEMEMSVYFFDKVDGKVIDATTADTTQEFPSEPYDWQGGSSETVNVIYHQPVFTIEQKRELGKRVYHGYVIELYYREQLQDTVAEPQELLEIHTEPADNRPADAVGPDGSLFPDGTNR